ncbi:MAG TPA: hypothetical protein VJZ91_06545 [Blastocatellia bacterium]|nr:hypothetical protein [Blastocatellia bacterium]
MAAKVRIKAGPVEFEYEGETELGLADIKDLFTHIETLFKVPVLAEGGQAHVASAPLPAGNGAGVSTLLSSGQKLHINSIATKLGTKTGPELAVAAAASLQIFEQKETFTRTELLEAMKKATMHYKDTMSGNLTSIIKSLLGPKLNQISDGVYSLTAEAYQDLVGKLA